MFNLLKPFTQLKISRQCRCPYRLQFVSQKFRAYCGCRQTCRSRSLHRAITETLLLCSGCCVATNVHISLSSPCFHCLSSPPAPVVNLSRESGLHLRHAVASTHRIRIVTRFIVESITSARLLLLGRGRLECSGARSCRGHGLGYVAPIHFVCTFATPEPPPTVFA